MRRLAVVLVLASPLVAQAVSFGVRGGLPLTPALDGAKRQPGQHIVGPLVEFHLLGGASLGAEFLFRRAEIANSAPMWRWEAPVTLIYRFPAPMPPFVRAGVALNHVYRTPDGSMFELRHRSTHGFIIGGGLTYKWKAIALEPELRLTRWVDRNFGTRESTARSPLNEVAVLLGFRY